MSRSLMTSLLISEAKPDSSSASTVEDKCLPILSAAKNMYLALANVFWYSGDICFINCASFAICAISLVSISFLGYFNSS